VLLLAIMAELHVFEEEIRWDEPLRIGILTSGQRFIRMWQQRGDNVGFDERPLEPEDYGEGGRVEVHDITDRLGPSLRGQAIGTPRIIQDQAGAPIGLALPRPGQMAFCLWINDDVFCWGDEAALAAAPFPEGTKATIGGFLHNGREI
jgi:hypothetical protein